MMEVSEIGLKEEEIELDLGLSIGGSFRKSEKPKPVENPTGPDSRAIGFDSDVAEHHKRHQATPVIKNGQQESTMAMDPQTKREIQALRRQEAKKKREEKQQKRGTCRARSGGDCVRESEPEDQRVSKRDKTDHQNGSGSECCTVNLNLSCSNAGSTTSFPVTQVQQQPHPYVPVQYVPFSNGLAFPCVVPCWAQNVNEKNVKQPAMGCKGFRPFSANGSETQQNGERDGGDKKTKSNGSSMCSSSVISDYQSSSHEGGGSTDTHSHSAHSLATPAQLNSSKENNIGSQHEQTASSHPMTSEHGNAETTNPNVKEAQPKITQPVPMTKRNEEAIMGSKEVPITKPLCDENSSDGSLKEAKTETEKPPKPLSQTSSLPHMPYVSATGNGPNGKTVNGFLYRYTKSEVSIVCVCHGSTFSPAEFVQHAGGTDISHPLRHITVVPSAFC